MNSRRNLSIRLGLTACAMILSVSLCLSATAATLAETELPEIRIELSAAQVQVGDIFEVAVWLQGFDGDYGDLQGFEIHVVFDPALVQPAEDQGKLEPAIFPAEAGPMSLLNKVDKNGEISIAQTLTKKTMGLFTGYGKAATVRLKAVKAGKTEFKQTKSIVIKPDNAGVNIKHQINHPVLAIGQVGGTAAVAIPTERRETVGTVPSRVAKALTGDQVLKGFKDYEAIAKMKWPAESIAKLASAKVVAGTTEGKFEPQRNMTRAEFTKVLITSFGFDMKQSMEPTFRDVKKTDWFYDYVETAVRYGIVSGSVEKGEKVFQPNHPISRGEMASILYHAMVQMNDAPKPDSSKLAFSDIQEDYWARDAVAFLVQNGFAAGKGANTFAPRDFTTRAEACVVLAKMAY